MSKALMEVIVMRTGPRECSRIIAPDKAVYCVFTQFRERENAIKFISVRTIKILDSQFQTFS